MASSEIADIESWLAATDTAETTLGKLACQNTYAVSRIRNGSASIDTLKAVMAYISAHPPKRKRA